jgi:hypothetical protein
MTTRLQINLGAGLVYLGTGPTVMLPDPMDVEWFDEGAEYFTDSNSYVTFKRSSIRLIWQNLKLNQFGAIMDFWKSAKTARFKATQVRVPRDTDFAWTTFTRYSNRGIVLLKPSGQAQGVIVPQVEWVLKDIKRSID